jgi:hypothetical protein
MLNWIRIYTHFCYIRLSCGRSLYTSRIGRLDMDSLYIYRFGSSVRSRLLRPWDLHSPSNICVVFSFFTSFHISNNRSQRSELISPKMKLLTTCSVLLVVNISLAFSAAIKTARNTHKHFELDITWEPKAPDGFERYQILINGKSPGPLIRVTEGDSVEVSRDISIKFICVTDTILSVDSDQQ